MTHASLTPQQRADLDITDDLLRLSVGIEEVEDLVADLNCALDAVPELARLRTAS
jgi:cystathionine beta-lyase/cystathionine gamma-synthase